MNVPSGRPATTGAIAVARRCHQEAALLRDCARDTELTHTQRTRLIQEAEMTDRLAHRCAFQAGKPRRRKPDAAPREEDYAPLMLCQIEMLRLFAATHGRTWKSRLRIEWAAGTAEQRLHALRNSHGPSWLDAYRLPPRHQPDAGSTVRSRVRRIK